MIFLPYIYIPLSNKLWFPPTEANGAIAVITIALLPLEQFVVIVRLPAGVLGALVSQISNASPGNVSILCVEFVPAEAPPLSQKATVCPQQLSAVVVTVPLMLVDDVLLFVELVSINPVCETLK
jgi:hypothetical protein